jgi:collagen type III alpha
MPSAMLPDALADALGRVVADVQRQARKDIELIAAECRVMVANLKLEIAAFKEEVHRLHAEDRQRLGVALAAVKDGEPGAPGKDGRDGIDGKDGAPGQAGRDGIDGKDGAPGQAGRDGIDGKDGAPGRDGVDGISGRDGTPGLAGTDGRDGIDGKDGAPGLPGERGLPGQDGLEGKPGRDGRDGLPGLNGKDGEPGRAGLDGKDGRDGIDGRDGLGFEHLEERIEDGGRILIRTYRRGDEVKEFRHVTAMPVYRGVWKEGEYQRGDTVTRDGSQWHCETETTATPGLSPDWRLCVKHGRAGKDGKNGERGAPGPKGESGRDLTQLGFDGGKH